MKIIENSILSTLNGLQSIHTLQAHQLAALLKIMVKYEQKPGGPYVFGSPDDTQLNAQLARLFAQEGIYLSGAIKFSHVKIAEAKAPREQPVINQAWVDISQSLLQQFGSEHATELQALMGKLANSDTTGEISQLSKLFIDSLIKTANSVHPPISAYDMANQYTWIAYSLYDQLLDAGESAHLLPIANHCLATSITLYCDDNKDTTTVLDLFTRLNRANATELLIRNGITADPTQDTMHINQTPHTKNLAIITKQLTSDRSIAHIIGPVLIARQLLGCTQNIKQIQAALTNYCYARQLLDDLHDWKQDIINGQPTYVIAKLIQDAQLAAGSHALNETLTLLEQTFFKSSLLEILDEIDRTLSMSSRVLSQVMSNQHSPFIQSTIQPLQLASQQARKKHTFSREFLKAYGDTE